jgi:competence protein ComGC
MEETNNLDAKLNEEKAEKKLRDKKNTFTLIYILVGIFLIAVLGILAYAFLVTR